MRRGFHSDWGIGLGTALMQALLKELTILGYKKLSLRVDKSNRAVNLYKNLNSKYKVIKEQENDLLMVKGLPAR